MERVRAAWGERGLFDSGPRFVVIVALLAAATTGPTAAVALAGHAALAGGRGPASTPMVATGPALTSVRVPSPGSGTGQGSGAQPTGGPMALVRDEEHTAAPDGLPTPLSRPTHRFE